MALMTKIKEQSKTTTTIKEYNTIQLNTKRQQQNKYKLITRRHTYVYAPTHTVNHFPTNKY